MGFRLNATAPDRFWAKVTKTETCWLWTARRDKDGYGKFRPDGANTSDVGAHRVAFVIAGGALVDGDLVCHTCDNPPCVRADHLFIGTHADNIADRDHKGRGKPWPNRRIARGRANGRHTHPEATARGERNGHARWTAAEIREIRAAFAGGESQGSIARRLGTAQPVISRIVLRQSWAHVE